jgi:hypothetical protein
LAPEDLEL